MRTKNAKAITRAESEHMAKIKAMACCICGCPGPSDAHHIEQGMHFTSLPLCRVCHMHPVYGFHGQRANWKARKLDELSALNAVVGILMEEV